MNNNLEEPSPQKSAIEELGYFRKCFRETMEVFGAHVEADIVRVSALLEQQSTKRRGLNRKQIADVRDLLTMLRRLKVKPAKGRQRDLKKYKDAASELRHMFESWE